MPRPQVSDSSFAFTMAQQAMRMRYAGRVAREARRIQASARRIARMETRLRAMARVLLDSTIDEDEGHSATQFGWRSGNEGFKGIEAYAEAVAECAECLLHAPIRDSDGDSD